MTPDCLIWFDCRKPAMTEISDSNREISHFRRRLVALGIFSLICFAALVARLVWLQVVRHDHYLVQAENNRIALVPIVPNRGLILDRNGVVLASNYSAYTLEITPSKLEANLDSVLDELAKLVAIEPRDRRRFRHLMEESKPFASIPIRIRLTDEEVARFAAEHFRFPGVEVQARLFRQYPLGEVASHVIGYIGRINQQEAKDIEDNEDPALTANYNGTDHIGKEGLEKSYERQLHGQTGYEEVERSASGRAIRTLSRRAPVAGSNLILSIDVGLQKVAEEAFGDMRGALVAIEPRTGDVLAYVSRPGFDPNLFVDGIDTEKWEALNASPDKPLLNRPLSGTYPPGSTFKPFMALAALELGKRRPEQAIQDPGFFMLGGHRFNDDRLGGHGAVDMYRSIVMSCDTYYYQLGNDLGIDAINGFIKQFGFGQPTGIDLDHERVGVLPSQDWKRERFKRNRAAQKWVGGDTISVSIGQGFNNYTMLQLAHAVATLANDGIVMRPHLVKIIEDGMTGRRSAIVSKPSGHIPLSPRNIEFIKHAMVGVTSVPGATGYRAFQNSAYSVAGKTGTAQVAGLRGAKYSTNMTPEHLRDNALFTAFAPAEKPRIAIAVVVENAGAGGIAAAPIVRKVLDFYLSGANTGMTR
jgi:penicillin-binding protein 2